MQEETGEKLRLVLKNPAQPNRDFPLELPSSSTVGDLKNELQRTYPGQPRPALQKLIFAGRILADEAQSLAQLFATGKCDPQKPQAVHLVLPPPSLSASTSGVASPAMGRAHVQPDLRRSAPAGLGAAPQVQQPAGADLPAHGQPHPRFVPGHGLPPPPHMGRQQAAPAGGAPADAPAPGPGLVGRQNWGLLFKIVIILYILGQGGDPTRLLVLTLAGFLVYLYQIGMFPRLTRPAFWRPAAAPPAPNQQPDHAPAPAPQAVPRSAEATPAAPQEQHRTGFLREMENIFLPLICSLIPNWQPQAAQPMAMPGAHPHRD